MEAHVDPEIRVSSKDVERVELGRRGADLPAPFVERAKTHRWAEWVKGACSTATSWMLSIAIARKTLFGAMLCAAYASHYLGLSPGRLVAGQDDRVPWASPALVIRRYGAI